MTGASSATGRPTRLPRSARREQLLAAAQDVFVAHGYHAAAMDDIAERAGVSKPVLYQHFPGKLELYLALLDMHCDAFADNIRAAMTATTNAGRVRAAMHAYFDFVSHESEAFRLVFESDLRNEPSVRASLDRMERVAVEAVTETIMADTGLDRARAEMLAAGLCGAAQVAARWWLAGGRQVTQEESEQLISQLAWRGIGGYPLVSEH